MSHVIVWEFRVREGHEREFEEVYGPHGAWAVLFGRSQDFGGTELLRDSVTPRRYLTLVRWTSAEAFASFREAHAAEYRTLDATCESWTEAEKRVGAWTTIGS